MIHEILSVGPLQCNCSVVGDEQTREAMVIDPGDDIEQMLAILQRHGLTVKQIVITHAHIDHIGGAAKLKRITGAPVLLNANDQALLKMLDVQATWLGMRPPENTMIDAGLTTGDKLQAGRSRGRRAAHARPYRGQHLPVLCGGEKTYRRRYTVCRIHRPHRPPGGSYKKIMESLHGPVLALPDETIVVPGHGPLTTIGDERETNPFLAG